jgi:phage host-nuclease inhibitor protein Gam
MTDTSNPNIESLTRTYLKIRDKRAALKAEYDEQEETLSVQMNAIKVALLDYCKQNSVESVRTNSGLFYRTVKTRYWTNDWESFHKFVVSTEAPDLLEKRINQSAMKVFLEENPEHVPPGLNTDSEYIISVRKK